MPEVMTLPEVEQQKPMADGPAEQPEREAGRPEAPVGTERGTASDLLLEIGCEELPATFVAPALAQLEAQFREKFGAVKLWDAASGGTVRTYGTPRRMVIHAGGVAARQPDETVTVKGPAQNIAFDADGKPTPAGLGFARKNNIAPEELTVVDGYVQISVTRPGRPAIEIAAELLPAIARALTFPKAMRWGSGKLRFARPIRWILALLDEEVIPFSIEHVPAGRKSRGHRFLAPQEFDVPDIRSYFNLIGQHSVLIDPTVRRSLILTETRKLALDEGGTAVIDDDLLDENVFLTEYPTAVLGSFATEYMALPRPILVTAMRKHQRYFPVTDSAGELLPRFIAIRNGGGEYLDTVRAGYEHVLSARFNDAKFFLDLDTQTPLSAKIEGTKKIVFQEKLGSVYQKSQRLGVLLAESGLATGATDEERAELMRAAELCKADLASEMVKELPALQGVVGADYAGRDGEPEAVCKAIVEHYMPKGAGEALPVSPAGLRLAIADRVDTLIGYLGIGIMPSGSSDPFALRRAAAGLVALLATSAELPPLRFLFDAAWAAYQHQEIPLTEAHDTAYANFVTLVSQRLDAALDEAGVRYDLRDAALSVPFSTVFEADSRAAALQAAADTDDFRNALAAATRIGNILRFAQKEKLAISAGAPHADLFEHDAERNLWNAWTATELAYNSARAVRDWKSALHGLANLRVPTDAFFDSVMVISDDTARRDNRLALLARLREAFDHLADFDKVVTG
jgi:glycyl-tRNA synthetase beta chain